MLIDWFTVAAQAINFLILVLLLRRFLYGPIVKAMDDREAAINAIRTHRGPDALFNMNFANWIIEEGLHFLGMSPSQQVA